MKREASSTDRAKKRNGFKTWLKRADISVPYISEFQQAVVQAIAFNAFRAGQRASRK